MPRSFEQLAEEAGLGKALVRARVVEMAGRVMAAPAVSVTRRLCSFGLRRQPLTCVRGSVSAVSVTRKKIERGDGWGVRTARKCLAPYNE
jgi:hypothetical protein